MKIVLYSGGLDSYIGNWLLHREDPSWLPVYFDLNTQYSWKERTAVERQQPNIGLDLHDSKHYGPGVLDLSNIERSDGYVPQRNVLLCATAQAVYSASEIALCSVADDVYADNTTDFHKRMSWLLSFTAGHDVRVFSPLTWGGGTGILRTKAEAVALYLKEGGDADVLWQTVSCYDPVEVSCGHCTACVRRREALEANGISL